MVMYPRQEANQLRNSDNPELNLKLPLAKHKSCFIVQTSGQLHAAEIKEMTLCGSHNLWYVTLCVILSRGSLAFDLNKKHQTRHHSELIYSLQFKEDSLSLFTLCLF